MDTGRHANTRFFRSFYNFVKTANPADGGSLLKAAFLCACTVIMLAATAPGVHAQTIMPERSTASCEGVLDTYQFSRIDDISQSGSPEPTIGLGQTFLAKETGDLARAQVLVRDPDYLAQGSMNVELRPLTSQGWPSNSEILASDVVEASEVSDGGAEWGTANFGPGVKVTKGQGYALTLTPRGGTTTIGWAGNGQNICTDGDVFTSMSGGFQNYATNLAGEYTRDRYYRVFVQPPPNSAPVANNDTLQAGANQKLTVDAPGVLANDTDANGDHLTASLVQTKQHSELSLNTDGSFPTHPMKTTWGRTPSPTKLQMAWTLPPWPLSR